ncbi:hypothetical protein Pcinc_012922 [Petrolisthes cinctipes]|uniref:Methionine synthase reductase n=1 Tax=Petrolisthes cinctipes TaxID=88211 RepID=A0AAE1FZP5_PETCI|nr:hypothetical protein Pcinc_012922 [Petrolisthes cinctipes]
MRNGLDVTGEDLLLLYASQNGNAKGIAEDLYEVCVSSGLKCELKCCSEVDTLDGKTCLVLIASTTGDGDPPDTARKFWRRLNKRDTTSTTTPLASLYYTVLGLGDTNYTNFCNFGKTVDQKLCSLGAKRFYECGWADDGTGLEVVVEPWIENLPSALRTHLSTVQHQPHLTNTTQLTRHTREVILEGGCACGEQMVNMNGNTEVKESKYIPDVMKSGPDVDDRKIEQSNSSNSMSDSGRESDVERTIQHNHNNQKQTIVVESSRMLEETKDKLLTIAAKYKIDLLPQEELENLPLKSCAFPLETKLTLPILPPSYLSISYQESAEEPLTNLDTSPYPSAASEPIDTIVESVKRLTRYDAIKTTLEVKLRLSNNTLDKFEYEPGDSYGVLVRNPKCDVEMLLHLLGLTGQADNIFELSVMLDTKKKCAAVPSFIPARGFLRNILESCVDIRAIPKKPLVRSLVEHTADPKERRRLQELVSKEGAGEYSQHVRGANLSLLDLLIIFSSCQPPITTLLEHLPRLLPRAYSIISSPLINQSCVTFACNIIEIPRINSVTYSRRGISTGWFSSLCKDLCDAEDIAQPMGNLTLNAHRDIHAEIYKRSNQNFHLPKQAATPIIMVGPGTGVAPFVGFLRHREKIMAINQEQKFGESWLFYGCRHRERDFIFKEELQRFEQKQILNHFIVSFSREEEINLGSKYVQHNIVKHGNALANLLLNLQAIIYICGDAQNMAKDVFEAFVNVLDVHVDIPDFKPREYLAEMQLQRRYLQDIWS